MSLTVSTNRATASKESTAELVGAYLRGVVREMRKIDYMANFFDELPKRSTERKVAMNYMDRKPLRVQNAAEAGRLIAGAEKHYKAEADKASLRTKIDYALGATYKKIAVKTILGGAALTVGAVMAANGAHPESVAAVAAVGIGIVAAGGSIVRAVQGTPAYEADRKKHARDLDKYTEAKEALFALKMMKRQLKSREKVQPNGAVLSALKSRQATY